jgi:4-hydroxy-tetrahydrodipicolinate synthase
MKTRPLTGTITALVTPFRQGKIDHGDLKRLIEHQISGGIDGLVPVGTTGESPTVNHEEHIEIIQATVELTRGRVPVIAGTGSNSTQEAVELTQQAHAVGADAMLVVAPYYNKPGAEGLFRHFCAVAEATDKPIILYSIPGRCGIEIGIPVVERLRAKYKHVRWIKEAGGSVDRVDQLKHALGSDITVLSGDDSLTLPFMAVGGVGVVSVASNLIPKQISDMVKLALAGDYTGAGKLHHQYYPLLAAFLKLSTNPIPIKAAMALAGHCTTEIRLPMVELEEAKVAELKATMVKLGLL